MLTAKMIKDCAIAAGADLCGIASVERFQDAPKEMHPLTLFPEAKSVIVFANRILKGCYKGIQEGTDWSTYWIYGYGTGLYTSLGRAGEAINSLLEEHGYEGVHSPGSHTLLDEAPPAREPLAKGKLPPCVTLHMRVAAALAGLGEPGWSKVFLTRKWGPRVRIGTILTDAELEPDPLIKPGTLCNRCMKCVRTCPGRAIPSPGERPPVRVEIGDQVYEWGDVSMGRCTLTHHGLNRQVSPFLVQDFPTVDFKVPESRVSEELAYRMAYTLATGTWVASEEFPHGNIVDYYHQILGHVGYFAICGAQGCVRGCMDSLEKRHAIEQSAFKTAVSPRGQWTLRQPEDEESAGIAEGTCAELYRQPDLQAGRWS